MVVRLRDTGRQAESCSAPSQTLPDLPRVGILDVRSQKAAAGSVCPSVVAVSVPACCGALGEGAQLAHGVQAPLAVLPSVPTARAAGAHVVSDPGVQERSHLGHRHRGRREHAAAAAPHRHHPGTSLSSLGKCWPGGFWGFVHPHTQPCTSPGCVCVLWMIPSQNTSPGSQLFAPDISEGIRALLKAWLLSPDVWKLPDRGLRRGSGGWEPGN